MCVRAPMPYSRTCTPFSQTALHPIHALVKAERSAAATAAPTTSTSGNGEAGEASSTAAGSLAAAEGASAPPPQDDFEVDDVSLDLLLAKVYSGWRGHDNDTLKVGGAFACDASVSRQRCHPPLHDMRH